eukprot:Selendium_serpulae@DN6422_c0_g1_i1.p1
MTRLLAMTESYLMLSTSELERSQLSSKRLLHCYVDRFPLCHSVEPYDSSSNGNASCSAFKLSPALTATRRLDLPPANAVFRQSLQTLAGTSARNHNTVKTSNGFFPHVLCVD